MPAVVEVDVDVAGLGKARIDQRVGHLADHPFVDVTAEFVPGVPPHRGRVGQPLPLLGRGGRGADEGGAEKNQVFHGGFHWVFVFPETKITPFGEFRDVLFHFSCKKCADLLTRGVVVPYICLRNPQPDRPAAGGYRQWRTVRFQQVVPTYPHPFTFYPRFIHGFFNTPAVCGPPLPALPFPSCSGGFAGPVRRRTA